MIQPYNPLRPLFYPMILLILFGSIYWIYQSNPALMDQLSLIEKQRTSTKADTYNVSTGNLDPEPADRFQATALSGSNYGNSSSLSGDIRIEHRFDDLSEQLNELSTNNSNWIADDQGLVLRNETGFQVYDSEGKLKWKFLIEESPIADGPIASTSQFLYFSTKAGDLICLYRDSGRIAWIQRLGEAIATNPLVGPKSLILFVEGDPSKNQLGLRIFDKANGNDLGKLNKVPNPTGGTVAFHEAKNLLALINTEGKIIVFDLNKKEALWSYDFPNQISASPVIAGDRLYISSAEGQLFAMDVSSGRQLWDYDLKGPIAQALTVMPQIQIGIIADKDNYLHVMDLQAGKRKWRYNLKTNAKNYRFVAARMTDSASSRLNMSAESKGWAFWGPCGDNKICAFEPFKGFILRQIELPGPISDWPHFLDKGFEMVQSYLDGKNLKFRKFIEKRKFDKIKQEASQAPVDNAPTEN